MPADFTLFIPTYNRPEYLERILKYYASSGIKILVADSSYQPYNLDSAFPDVTYLHTPEEKLPKKMAIGLGMISTKYMAICADDDFTVQAGIIKCVNFLEANKDFAAAQGNTLSYKKDNVGKADLSFSVLYKNTLSFRIDQENPFERLSALFHPYRTIFTAVHHTKNLQLAFNEAIQINNLFLNEYLSGIVPILKGKYIELPVFFQVREYASGSGDKVTDNMDVIVNAEIYKEEYHDYLDYIATIIANEKIAQKVIAVESLKKIFADFAAAIVSDSKKRKKNLALKIAGGIINLPSITTKALAKLKRGAVVNLVIKTDEDRKNLQAITELITQYGQL